MDGCVDQSERCAPDIYTIAAKAHRSGSELAVGNPGPQEQEVTLQLLSAGGELLATVSRNVPVNDSSHALFVFPEGGLPVTPGEVYSIRLSGKYLFGWKYVMGGYKNGEASFNGRPLVPDARSTFLFRTFGAR